MTGFKKVYSSILDTFDGDTFREKSKNHEKTIVIVKSNFGKILGCYHPMKLESANNWIKVTGGQSFIFFYEDDKLRICNQK